MHFCAFTATGSLSLTEDSFKMQAKGAKPDEALDVFLKLPLLTPEIGSPQRSRNSGEHSEGGAGLFKFNLGDFLPIPDLESEARNGRAEEPSDRGGGHFSLRCGQMLVSAEVLLCLQ